MTTMRTDDQMTDLIRSDYHDEKVLRGTAKEVLEELSKGNAVLVHCAQGKYVNTNINRHKGFIIPKVQKSSQKSIQKSSFFSKKYSNAVNALKKVLKKENLHQQRHIVFFFCPTQV